MLRKFSDLPKFMQNDDVKKYYDILHKKRMSLLIKYVPYFKKSF